MSSARDDSARLSLTDYYRIEGLNAYGTTVFFMGVFFHARFLHGFSDTANLLLAVTQGAAYVLAARAAGRFADRVGLDRSAGLGLSGMCLALLIGWQSTQSWGLFASMTLYSAATALTWPALEAAIARAPGKVHLARRTGLYNVIWSLAGSVGFFLCGALFDYDPEAVFWAPLLAHALELLGLVLRTNPSARLEARKGGLHRGERDGGQQRQNPEASKHTGQPRESKLAPASQARFLRSAWLANGLSYFLLGAFAAFAPSIGARLGLGPRLAIWMVSAYLFGRSTTFVWLWIWSGWEYSRRWLAASLMLPPAAFAAFFFAPSPRVAIGALAVLGAMAGLAYSASLHASLDREGREGEGGGLHEWVIGLGILLGPLVGAAGVRLGHGPPGAGLLVTALGAAAALAGLATLLTRDRYGR